jgi:hypothetical protein
MRQMDARHVCDRSGGDLRPLDRRTPATDALAGIFYVRTFFGAGAIHARGSRFLSGEQPLRTFEVRPQNLLLIAKLYDYSFFSL